jgi:hypothetical protein
MDDRKWSESEIIRVMYMFGSRGMSAVEIARQIARPVRSVRRVIRREIKYARRARRGG